MSVNQKIQIGEKYELVRLLGEGGMGAVYLGRHKLIKKLVAVKILSNVLARNEQYVKRFYREATAAAAIHHPNVVDVLDIGEKIVELQIKDEIRIVLCLLRTGVFI